MSDDVADTDPTDQVISDEELTALALAADPHPVLAPDAAPWRPGAGLTGLLPEWYMPAPQGHRYSTPVKVAVGLVIASFILVNALGLCITYGFITLA